MTKKYTDLERWERFLDKVAFPEDLNGCWLWTGHIKSNGYGQFRKNTIAHREALEKLGVKIPAGMEPDHLCRTRHCVNPAHLEVVSPQENKLRAQTQGRGARKFFCPKCGANPGNRCVLRDGRTAVHSHRPRRKLSDRSRAALGQPLIT